MTKTYFAALFVACTSLAFGQVGVGTTNPMSEFSVQLQRNADSSMDVNDGITLLDSTGTVLMSLSGDSDKGVYLSIPNENHDLVVDRRNLNFDAALDSRALISLGETEGANAMNQVNDTYNGWARTRAFELFYNGSVGYGIGFHPGGAEFYKSAGGTIQFGYENGDNFYDILTIGGSSNPYMTFGYGTTGQANSYGISTPRTQIKNGVWTNTHMAAEGYMFASAFHTSSDRRLKTNISDLESAMAVISELRPVRYTKKACADHSEAKEEYGFIAQEVNALLPEVVSGSETDTSYLSLNYTAFIPILTKGLQEQEAVINHQASQIEELQAAVHSLEEAKTQAAGLSLSNLVSFLFGLFTLSIVYVINQRTSYSKPRK